MALLAEPQANVNPLSIYGLIISFLQSIDVSEASRNLYKRQLKQFTAWLKASGKFFKFPLEKADILEYKAYLMQNGKSIPTVQNYLTAVRNLFNWLEHEKGFRNVARTVKPPARPKGFAKDCLTPMQIQLVLNSIDRSCIKGLRDYALFNLLVRTGLRTIEIQHACIGDVRQQYGQAILWIKGKGRLSKDDFVLLTDEALHPIKEYISKRGPAKDEEPLFASLEWKSTGHALSTRSIRKLVKELLANVGIVDKRLSAHSLRHTAISLSVAGGASLEQAQAMARHSDPKTTLIYFHNHNRISHGAEKYIKF